MNALTFESALETSRLILYPLDEKHLRLWADDMDALERELKVTYRGECMDGPFRRSVRDQLEQMELDPENYKWHTFWLLIGKGDRIVVGALGFETPPDESGQVEMGYGLGEGFNGKGYMSEAVTAICGWALHQPGVRAIIARTDPENYKSQCTLSRCGFSLFKKDFDFFWRLTM